MKYPNRIQVAYYGETAEEKLYDMIGLCLTDTAHIFMGRLEDRGICSRMERDKYGVLVYVTRKP